MALYLANNFGAKLSVFLSHDGASGGETGLSTSVAVYYVTHYSTLRRDHVTCCSSEPHSLSPCFVKTDANKL